MFSAVNQNKKALRKDLVQQANFQSLVIDLSLGVELIEDELGEVLAVPVDQVVGDEQGSTLDNESQYISEKTVSLGRDV